MIDLTELIEKTNLHAADRRIGAVVAARRAEHKAWVRYRAWLKLAVFYECYINIF